MKSVKRMLPYLIVNAAGFYLLPLFIADTGSAMMVLLLLIPLLCFAVSFVYGVKNSFNLLYAVLTAALFAPTVFIYYNESALIYIGAYGVSAIMGNGAGRLLCKKKHFNRN